MNRSNLLQILSLCIASAGATGACAHVTLPPGAVTVGGDYTAAFRVGHACTGAAVTTALDVRLPQGFVLADAQPRPGWKLDVQRGTGEVRWTAESSASALPGKEPSDFVLHGKVPATPQTLWFKVLQTCDVGSADWAQVPAADGSTQGLETPAAWVKVVAKGVSTVDVRGGWVRPSVPGQSGSGAFMKLTAPAGARLVGVATPAAGVAEVHEMKMDGDTMRMREVQALNLPAGKTVELTPGGYHVMLMDLKQPLAKGTKVPMTLRFEDAKGASSTLQVELPVGEPAGGGAMQGHQHMH